MWMRDRDHNLIGRLESRVVDVDDKTKIEIVGKRKA